VSIALVGHSFTSRPGLKIYNCRPSVSLLRQRRDCWSKNRLQRRRLVLPQSLTENRGSGARGIFFPDTKIASRCPLLNTLFAQGVIALSATRGSACVTSRRPAGHPGPAAVNRECLHATCYQFSSCAARGHSDFDPCDRSLERWYSRRKFREITSARADLPNEHVSRPCSRKFTTGHEMSI